METLIKDFKIREAEPADVAEILSLIKELADFENLSHEVEATTEKLSEGLFGENKCVEAILGVYKGETVAFMLFFHNYSTFLAQPGIFLEDLFVRKSMRGKGFGKCLISHLAQIAIDRNCGRLEWSVLDWNEPAIKFYESLGAEAMDEWTVNRVTGSILKKLADGNKS